MTEPAMPGLTRQGAACKLYVHRSGGGGGATIRICMPIESTEPHWQIEAKQLAEVLAEYLPAQTFKLFKQEIVKL